jgi:uncharacterized protein (TIGR02147 family)
LHFRKNFDKQILLEGYRFKAVISHPCFLLILHPFKNKNLNDFQLLLKKVQKLLQRICICADRHWESAICEAFVAKARVQKHKVVGGNTPTNRLSVIRYVSSLAFLQDLYSSLKMEKSDYSYLKFSSDMGLGASNVLRLILAGKRPLTEKAALKISENAEFSEEERKYFQKLVAFERCIEPARKKHLFEELLQCRRQLFPQKLSSAQAEYFSQWYHPVLREMTGLESFDGTPEWLRDALVFPLRLDAIKESLALLVRLGFLQIEPITQRYQCQGNIQTAENVDDLSLVAYHRAMLEKAQESITHLKETEREIRAITVRLGAKEWEVLKEKMRVWTEEILALEESACASGDSCEVRQINIQMFPFSQRRGKK